ncbi:cytochrome P450 [Karstenula rhodostoma CBS 690.94]|uniref:Cytochrome P450 n=1 Tax=Karstenula rhodostoma CBS 690.94 TaxID=1392251 RepID=A0A9P4UCM7_9PLEO|nr:cytochrome P450 [Karstenula rhodostoma CBS 690.94]
MIIEILNLIGFGLLGLASLPFVFFAVAVAFWRLWSFTIKPWLHPEDPVDLPYWIPYLGHSLSFFGNSDKLLEKGLNYVGRSHAIFGIQTLKRKLYIITDPADVSVAFNNNTALHFDGHLNELLINFGFSGEALRRAWHVPQPGDWCYLPGNAVNPDLISLNRLTEDVYRKQLLPGEKMDFLCKVFLESLTNTLNWENLDFCIVGNTEKGKLLSLQKLCRYTMVEATTQSLFGGHLHQLEPKIVDYMLRYNDNAWMVFFQYPDLFGTSPITEPRRMLTKVLEEFLQLPDEERNEQAWSIKTITAWQEVMGIDLRARASVLLMIYWAANSNEYNISFWVLAHVLHNPDLLQVVQDETEMAWVDGKLDIKYLCSRSPNLDAIFNEALRCNGGAMVSRIVMEPITIGDKLLKPGNAIIIPSRQLHMNEKVWGQNRREFDAFRFKRQKNLSRHPSYRPFGGGNTYCPGRVLAKEEVFGFLAILFRRFHLNLAEGVGPNGGRQNFPSLDDSSPALGITGPVKSHDVLISTMARTT